MVGVAEVVRERRIMRVRVERARLGGLLDGLAGATPE